MSYLRSQSADAALFDAEGLGISTDPGYFPTSAARLHQHGYEALSRTPPA
ncbi:hypothetical protein OHA98_23760 [Streptomyces sp. NBC_00654]|nr:hypothetical protein [Streptomyces sp. NBC_00654]MCX4967720.1 hypothetical protein [Streptomyces sp. NBC_00654]